MCNELLDEGNASLKLDKFPQWVNRLARVGSSLTNDDMTAECDVIAEARIAAGVKGKVGWDLTTTTTSSSSSSKNNISTDKSRSQKKVLTEKQKAVLAKLKK